ncbi:MAG: ribosome small subunit-dependent GTPase A [Candidatus Kapabacteria bacterium]|nr:ribosome small subunit-dependent GTPase A [Candidatus Kapabacteria bacterium]
MIVNDGTLIDSEVDFEEKIYLPKTSKRTLIKSKRLNKIASEKGIIVSNPGKNFFVVRHKDFKKWNYNPIECVRGGTLVSEQSNSTIISVGDIVDFSLDSNSRSGETIGLINKVYQRKSFISRKSIRGNEEDVLGANIDNVLIFMSVNQPHFNRRLIDRIIIASEVGNAKPAICINKIDLDKNMDFLEELKIYKKLRIKIFTISALKKTGLDILINYFKNSVTAVIGPSGSGKSTMLNAVLGQNIQKVGELRHKQTKGKHTTSYSTMFFLKEGGAIIDTPGIREFGIYGIDKDEVCFYFKEFDKYYEECKFMPCTHTHEPNCKVKEAVEKGKIDEERYISYLNIYDSMQ